eukprot:augustus_masked-scaffold_1-processed-gene-12.3-mRNA-1 protein AED:0.42 eAED:0.46 QI:0/-1/0/1/-1/1/1/0/491
MLMKLQLDKEIEAFEKEEEPIKYDISKIEQLNPLNIVVGKQLSEGSFGIVFECFKVVKGLTKKHWPKFALKKINVMEKTHKELALREIHIMEKLIHPNILTLIGYYFSTDNAYINLVIEFAEKGDLHSLLMELISLEHTSIKFILGEVSAALHAVHKQNLLFGDLKPENILVFENNHVKLCDFGATRKITELNLKEKPKEGTLIYLAPELAFPGSVITDGSSDYWSLGVLAWQMRQGKPPEFTLAAEYNQTLHPKDVMPKKRSAKQMLLRGKLTEDNHLDNLIEGLLKLDWKKRFTFKDIETNTYFETFIQEYGLFDELHDQVAPVLQKNEKTAATSTPWTQRTYSMFISPVPQKFSAENEGGITGYIPANPGDEKLIWKSDGNISDPVTFLKGMSTVEETMVKPLIAGDKVPVLNTKGMAGYLLNRNNKIGISRPSHNSSFQSVPVTTPSSEYQKYDYKVASTPKLGKRGKQKPSTNSKYMINGVDLSAG